jgi:hypothetical protein
MTLRVPFDGFATAVREQLKTKSVYVWADGARTILTAGESGSTTIVLSRTPLGLDAVKEKLAAEKLEVREGVWSVDDDFEFLGLPWVAAVAYRASKGSVGVWLEVYPTEPTESMAMESMYDEFCESGEVSGIPLVRFIEMTTPQVQVIGPVEMAEYLQKRRDAETR